MQFDWHIGCAALGVQSPIKYDWVIRIFQDPILLISDFVRSSGKPAALPVKTGLASCKIASHKSNDTCSGMEVTQAVFQEDSW